MLRVIEYRKLPKEEVSISGHTPEGRDHNANSLGKVVGVATFFVLRSALNKN